ncbi:hypothetical protein F310043J5_16700 [Anaerostipes hominis (ex Lee et al. 2021)]
MLKHRLNFHIITPIICLLQDIKKQPDLCLTVLGFGNIYDDYSPIILSNMELLEVKKEIQ